MSEDRHINFKLMRERILALQDRSVPLRTGSPDGSPGWGGGAGGSSRLTHRLLQVVLTNQDVLRSLEEFFWPSAPEFREFVEREYRRTPKSGTSGRAPHPSES